MKPHHISALLFAVAAAGCASFEHQVAETVPHAVVHFTEPFDDRADVSVITRFDGVPVKTGRDFRVAPGDHRLTIRVSKFETARFAPLQFGSAPKDERPSEITVSPTGKLDASGGNPLVGGMQPVNIHVESREINHATSVITLEAGWRYELDAGNVRRTPLVVPRR